MTITTAQPAQEPRTGLAGSGSTNHAPQAAYGPAGGSDGDTSRECCGAPTPQAGRQGCCTCAYDADEQQPATPALSATDNAIAGKVDWEMVQAGRSGATASEIAAAVGGDCTPAQASRCLALLARLGYLERHARSAWDEPRYVNRTSFAAVQA
jgi:hypothetical protein